jgi:hypothetical protein
LSLKCLLVLNDETYSSSHGLQAQRCYA